MENLKKNDNIKRLIKFVIITISTYLILIYFLKNILNPKDIFKILFSITSVFIILDLYSPKLYISTK